MNDWALVYKIANTECIKISVRRNSQEDCSSTLFLLMAYMKEFMSRKQIEFFAKNSLNFR